jgi:hypothetical protein
MRWTRRVGSARRVAADRSTKTTPPSSGASRSTPPPEVVVTARMRLGVAKRSRTRSVRALRTSIEVMRCSTGAVLSR